MVERTFQDTPEKRLEEADEHSFLVSLGWSSGTTWKDLLRSKRVLIISEAGAGKTHECDRQAKRLWDVGEPAFFVELAGLNQNGLRGQLSIDEEERLDAWIASQSDIATFFLDSYDELKLTRGSFRQALKRFSKEIGDQLGQARIVITTRPIPLDEDLVRNILPVPSATTSTPDGETFAMTAMGRQQANETDSGGDREAPDWRTVGLIPLSDQQIIEFARTQGVDDPEKLFQDLAERNAQDFVRRPQDLIELCADWRENKRIRTHLEQVAENVRVKLKPRERDRRPEPADLSSDRAFEGASRLALAMQVTRRMTIRHSAESDHDHDEAALDPAKILTDWNQDERTALLERSLFGLATYGRVRFHHRSVAEFLAAKRLHQLRNNCMPWRALQRLLFAETKGKTIVRPSKRPLAGWLALWEDRIFEILREHEPSLLFEEGDPGSLSPQKRIQVLRAFVQRHGQGSWRGLSFPDVQIHRFASPEMSNEIRSLWAEGIENSDVREVLLGLVKAGRIVNCADIAHEAAWNVNATLVERTLAINAMAEINDPRLERIITDVATSKDRWTGRAILNVVLRLFPCYLSVGQLCQILDRIEQDGRGSRDLFWHLEHLITNSELDLSELEKLRDELVSMISAGLRWNDGFPHIVCDRPQLSGLLAAACLRGLEECKSDKWLHASFLAARLYRKEYRYGQVSNQLHERLANLTGDDRERLFWVSDRLIQSLHAMDDPRERMLKVGFEGSSVRLRAERDLGWVRDALCHADRSVDDRAMLLQLAMHLAPDSDQWRNHVSGLKPLVSDVPDLIAVIDARLQPLAQDKEFERFEKKQEKRKQKEEHQYERDKEKWISFWRAVSEQPEHAFSAEQEWNTAWNLWQAMNHDGENSRTSGWNRRFIEEHFGKETADKLRCALMNVWRHDHPTLPSERPNENRSTILVRWQLGHAAIYAEAEDSSWTTNLSEEEAKLATRYAPIALNELPVWMINLVGTHPEVVDEVLGNELDWELSNSIREGGHPLILRYVKYASQEIAGILLPRIQEWLNQYGDSINEEHDIQGAVSRLQLAIDSLLIHGDEGLRRFLAEVAVRRLSDNPPEKLVLVWLSVIMKINPALGLSEIENRIRDVDPERESKAVRWFGALFGEYHDAINFNSLSFTPKLLLRLLRLVYFHVRPFDDVVHEGVYTPDTRDHAERARSRIVNFLLEAKGEEGWAVKMEMAADPLFAHFKDRILADAEEKWAQEIDLEIYSEEEAVQLDQSGESPPSTNKAMFTIMCDRLHDLDDLLLRDETPRGTWAGISDERVIRREIARELQNSANGLYTVIQEAVTGNEKKTDIRLRSTIPDYEAVIELKIAENWSARKLLDAIPNQLVKKYMTAENRNSGCLLIMLANGDRKWRSTEDGRYIGPDELISLLRKEAEWVERLTHGISLYVHFLDLR